MFCLIYYSLFLAKTGRDGLGGDNSRLYFYDPLSYLTNQALYGVVPTGIGGEAVSYWAIPHLLLLAFFKYLFNSPTILISIFNGISLSTAFVSVYCIVREVTKGKNGTKESNWLESSAILAGFFYIFSPFAILGWDRAIITHYQIFLNPLIFFLLLRYFLSANLIYLAGIILMTLLFSPNFTYVAAPGFFSFYPLSFLFLLIYTKYIRKIPIPIKGLCFGAAAFLLLHAFHLVPQLLNLLSPDSGINNAVFSEKAISSRGLDYFIAIAQSVKASISFMGLLQLHRIDTISTGFIIFPAIIFLALWWSKTKTIFLTALFFLVTLFFATANITDLGFNFYKALFRIPGFSMFRNFYGQWGFTYLFFYSVLLGLSMDTVFNKVKKKYAYLLSFVVVGLSLLTAWPFINGSFYRLDLHQTKYVKPIIQMDPKYEKVLTYIRNLPVDGKILSFPFPYPGYQLIAGKNGGAYVGPSTFSYLAGKNDFSGYEGLLPFSEFFLQAVRNNDFESIKNLFSILNIRYIFYNSDPYIFDNTFPGFPYGYVRAFLPQTQNLYREFINKLPIEKKRDIGEKFHLYTIKDDIYFPHIYATTNIIQANNSLTLLSVPQLNASLPFAIFKVNNAMKNTTAVILEANDNNPLREITDNSHLHKHQPFISLKPDDIQYPFAILRERFDLWRIKNQHKKYMDRSFLLLTKRISEASKWDLPIVKKQWKEPKLWEFYNWKNYNSWESSIARYKEGMMGLMQWVNNTTESKIWQEANRIKIAEQLFQHQITLETNIKESAYSLYEKRYLLGLVHTMLGDVTAVLNIKTVKPSFINASLVNLSDETGEYEVYIEYKNENFPDRLSNAYIEIEGAKLRPTGSNINGAITKFENIVINGKKSINFTVYLPTVNLVQDSLWINSGETKNVISSTELAIHSISGNSSGDYAKETGLVKEITNWRPNRQYIVTFDYLTYGDDFIFKFYERRREGIKANSFFEKSLNSKGWKIHQSVFTSDPGSLGGYIHILANSGKINNKVLIKNLRVEEVPYPRILFKKVMLSKKYAAPQIIFTKINPTKYKVTVSGAKDPYALVFSEAFNTNWKLFNKDISSEEKIRGAISRMFGVMERFLVGIFVKDDIRHDMIQQVYLNGMVKEGMHTNTFLAPSTFETWGKRSIAEGGHFEVNGYANGWIIRPQDIKGEENYTLTIELSSQKSFYGFLFLSLASFLAVIIFFAKKIILK